MHNLICQYCGKAFSARNWYAKYCNPNCKSRAYLDKHRDEINSKVRENRAGKEDRKKNGKYTHKCIHCGITFRSATPTCLSCGKRDKLHRPDEKVNTIDVVCEYCGETFKKSVSEYNKDVRNGKPQGCCQLHTHVLKGNTLSLTCSECGKVFERAQTCCTEGQKHFFCSKECQDKNLDYILRGEDHYRYIDGKSSGYRGKGWTPIRKRIRERDEHTCYLCGKTREEIGKELDVHHLIRFEDFEDENDANQGINLISLCPSCHHSEEVNPTIPRIVPLIRERKERRAA
jgi:5-methylcytosine-specific restriction endonuclease McrA